ncbi:MAG: transaldolase [Acidobacteriales bacterium]|nr:transaldolase [Terriglobales bacterium]
MDTTVTLDAAKTTNALKQLQQFGQSIWLDYIRRNLLVSGELRRMIEEDGLAGMTSNPSIFEKSIEAGHDYDDLLKSLESRQDLDAKGRYEILAVRDIQDAADLLLPVYQATKGRDGYVSLEVSPVLANDTEGTLEEARRLWKTVNRENLMVKVPGTAAGIPAFQQLISEGININVTLLFSQQVYEKVAEAYIAGLEQLAARGGDVSRMASVASFFISRIDSAVDKVVAERLKTAKDDAEKQELESILGKVAVANGKQTYQRYLKIFGSDRWKKLAARGAQTQRVLWASTSTKNPKYSDILYVEDLIGKDTVNTVPPATLDAFRNHGRPRASLTEDVEGANRVMETVKKLGISMEKITDDLTIDGVKQFDDAFKKLLEAVARNTQEGSNENPAAANEAKKGTE